MARRNESGPVVRRGGTSFAKLLMQGALLAIILGLVYLWKSGAIHELSERVADYRPSPVEEERIPSPEELAIDESPAEIEPPREAETVESSSPRTGDVPDQTVDAAPQAVKEATTSNDEPILARARQLLAEGDAAGAREILRPLGDRGVPGALAQLGFLYIHGEGVAQDHEKGFEMLTRAARAGNAEGQYYLAKSYLHGTGTDEVLALAWFMHAAARGHPEATAERDNGLRNADEGIRVRAASKARDLAVPLPPGWLTDLDRGISVWGPSWFRNGTWQVAIEGHSVDGRAVGEASVTLTASLSGDTSRTYEGHFTSGYWIEERLRDTEVTFLESDEYRLPLDAAATGHPNIQEFWVQHEMGGLEITACTGQSPNLFSVMDPAFTGIEDEAVKAAAIDAVRAYMAVCPVEGNTPGNVTLLPPGYAPIIDRGDTTYEPQLSAMQLYGFDQPPETWSINLSNYARRAHEEREHEAKRQREKEEAERKRARENAAAMAREMPDIRGLELGMSLPEVRHALGDEAVEWSPPWKSNREMPAYTSFKQKVTLADRSIITAFFASRQNGSRLLVLLYEQNLRDGPDPETLRQKLYEKYGKPDDEAGQRTWLTWWLKGTLDGKPKGAFLKGRIQTDQQTGRVDYLRLVLNDYNLSLQDEAQGAHARREAKRQEYERSKSDDVKF